MTEELALEIADAILEDLRDRKGVGVELDMLANGDPDIYQEIRYTAARIVRVKVDQK